MLIEPLRDRLNDRTAGSFRLMADDLALVGVAELRAALEASDRALAVLPAELRRELLAEETALASEAHEWLVRHDRSVHARVAGYLALGRRCDHVYPWPVVAILGICQVMTAIGQNRLWGIAGQVATRLGRPRYERLADRSEDVLRRTNRGIFVDSVPTVLRVLRADELRRAGRTALATAIADGHAAPLWDDELRRLARVILDGLAVPDPRARFTALAAATLQHFEREQAIFTHHMGSSRATPPDPARAVVVETVPAPVLEGRPGARRLAFRPYRLPPRFDMRDHAARVRELGAAFVTSVTRDPDDFRVAIEWVERRFGATVART